MEHIHVHYKVYKETHTMELKNVGPLNIKILMFIISTPEKRVLQHLQASGLYLEVLQKF